MIFDAPRREGRRLSLKINKKLLLIILSLILATVLAGGTTVSYLLAQTPPAENSFTPVFVDCKVEESFNNTTKSNVTVKNVGDIAAYIRATYVVMWVAADGSVHSARPVEGVDYSITFGPPSWNLGTDGFYYYDLPVSAGSSTEVLIDQPLFRQSLQELLRKRGEQRCIPTVLFSRPDAR